MYNWPQKSEMDITRYDLDNLVLWDSPSLGDGKEADNRHANNITQTSQFKMLAKPYAIRAGS